MGQTILKAKTGKNVGGSISYTTSSIRHTGNERIYFGYYNGQQRVGITFPSLASQLQIDGEDINKIKITGITLNLYRNGGNITDTSNYYLAMSNEINYISYGNDGHALNDAVVKIATKELKGPMNGIVLGANAIAITNIDTFKDIVSNSEFYLYMYSASPEVQAENAQIAGSDVTNAPTITIDWIYTTSSFTSDSVVKIGQNYKITLNISNSSYTHKAIFKINDKTYEDPWEFSPGVSTIEKLVSNAYIEAIPSTTDRISGTLTVITYASSGEELGSASKAITFLIPKDDSFMPSGTLTLEQLPESTEAYVDRTYWNFTLEGKADNYANSSATVTNWHVYRRNAFNDSYGDWSTSVDGRTFIAKGTSPSVSTEGTYTWYAEITNSRGFTAQVKSVEVTIGNVSYDKPIKFNNIKAYRTDSSGTEKAEGTWYKLSGVITANDIIKSVTIYEDNKPTGTACNLPPNITSYDLSNIPAKETGTADLTASKNITIAVVLNNGATDRQVVTLLSAAYMLYFKKGGNALGIGKVTDKDNLLDIGWKTAITCSGSTNEVLALVGSTETEVSMGFGWSNDLLKWKMGYEYNEGVYTFFLKEGPLSYTDIVSITDSSTNNKMTLNSNGWTVTFNSDSILFTNGTKQYSLSNLSESGRILTSINSTFEKDVWIKYSGAPRLFLSSTAPNNAGIQAEILTTGNGLQFRNSVASNYGAYYDEYVFPPTSESPDTANTYTIYTSKNIIFNRDQPSNPIPPGTIWLQPVS